MRLFNIIGRLMGNIVSTFRGTAKNAKPERPSITSHHSEPRAEVTGRRARRYGTILHVQDVAARLNKQHPFFKMRSGGTYAVATRPVLTDEGKIVDMPTNFVRVDKNRAPVKTRKRMRRNARKLAEMTA